MSQEEVCKILDNHVTALMEHFGAVQIVVSGYDPEDKSTLSASRGSGDFNARYGAVARWLNAMDADDDMPTDDAEVDADEYEP
jgi:hypothetical protein